MDKRGETTLTAATWRLLRAQRYSESIECNPEMQQQLFSEGFTI